MATTVEELEEEIEDIIEEISSEKIIDVDKKIKIENRSASELSFVLGIKQAQLSKLKNSSGRNKILRGGFGTSL